jgi:sulfate adenylyltransferase subunit 2
MNNHPFTHLDALESEAIHIMREVAAECANPVLLFSGGKDSIVLLRLAEKAFRPGRFPFPLMHIDTEHNFPEVIAFRDHRVKELGERLIVRSMEDSIKKGRVVLRSENQSRNAFQSVTLLDAIAEFKFDACYGWCAARRRKSACQRENSFRFRDEFGQWDPKNQRPELMGSLSHAYAASRRTSSVCFLSATGRSWMFGNISRVKNWKCPTFILLMCEK